MSEQRRQLKIMMMETGGWGGIHYYAHLLGDALADCPVNLVLLTNERYELADRPRRFERVQMFRLENYLLTLFKLVRQLLRRRPDVLHIQSVIAPRKDVAVLLICRLLGVRVVMTVHNILPHEVRSFERALFALYYRLADALILHSERNRSQLLKWLPDLNPDRLFVVPFGNYADFRDLDLSRAEARSLLELPQEGKIALFFGAIRPYKGLDLFFQAVKPVRASCREAVFVVAGQVLRGEQADYEAQVAALGVGKEDLIVRFGYLSVADSIAYVCAADLVVLPYREIYQSGVLLFAFSFGRPVLATRVGSFPETVEEGKSGWLVDREDPEGLQQALIRLLQDPAGLELAGAHARQQAETLYGWPDIARKTVEVYTRTAKAGEEM